jgi:DNA polymerase-3 subunit beta
VLSELIDKTIFCTSKEESRFVLGGIFFEPFKEEGKLRAVASDGHRLVYLEREVEGLEEADLGEGFIVARKAAKQMEAIADEELVVKLAFVNNYVVLRTPNSVFFSRTIEGTFPDYKSVIPTSNENILKVDRKLFIDALKRVSLVATERFKPVAITLKEEEIVLTSQETEMGKAEIKLSAEYQGQPLSVNYNAQYLLDALENMKSEEIEMKIGEERTPAVITGYRDEGFLYLVMPMVL